MSGYTWPEIILGAIIVLFCASFVLAIIQWGLSFCWMVILVTLSLIFHLFSAIFRGIKSLFSKRE